MVVLVDSGATEQFFVDDLIPGLRNRMKDYALLGVPKTIVAAGNRKLYGTATGILQGTIIDQTGKTHRVRFPTLIVSGLGRHVFSFVTTKPGVATILDEGNPHIR